MSMFHDVHRELLGGDDPFHAFRLLQGFPNETLRANRALWQLGQTVRASATLRQIVAGTPAREVTRALEATAEGRTFLAALGAYLEEFGKRGSDFADADRPSWLEDPTPAIKALQGYVAGASADPEEERALLAAARDELLARTRARYAPFI